jgi:hypothetical protein
MRICITPKIDAKLLPHGRETQGLAAYHATAGLVTHGPDKCAGQNCCIHNPSPHHMVTWPMRWRADTGKMERICEHGIGHPDPDDAAYWERLGQGCRNIHGCDGCCRRPRAYPVFMHLNNTPAINPTRLSRPSFNCRKKSGHTFTPK